MENNRLLESILNSVSEGVMTLDKDWRIASWNRAAEKITGYFREEVLGTECAKIFRSPICRENCPVDRALSCGHPYQDIEVAIRNKCNEVIHLLVNAAPLYNPDGELIGGLETFRDVSQNHWMQEELQRQYGYDNIVGKSQSMNKVYESVDALMNTDTTVLIQGESGTGKELIARALHFYGPRKEKSFVAINCSALPEGVLETELFGHVRGAFTGAVRNHVGKFELANGGTLFLDEIGEISPAIQVKLLRVLEEREIQRVGDNRSIKIDIRLITATNKDLYKKVLEDSFRDDLYYRLSVFPLHLPPLRDRIEDIPFLVSHFINKFNKQMGKSIQGIADGVLEILEMYPWPGNVRELANAVEYAFVHARTSLIHPGDLPIRLLNQPVTCHEKLQKTPTNLDAVERQIIVNALETADWKKSLAASRLGMSRATLWRKIEKYHIGQ
ncbi:MAG: sigma 54-interacting transcriptional regulator [Deltaproteobacteria bacterium]|nr:sigma 54-interacting transcriptional regulator [Deltaproteobacteria bacterium]